jgi:hypothetical protein
MVRGLFDWDNIDVRMYGFTDPAYVFDENDAILSHVGVPVTTSLTLTGMVATATGFCRSDAAVLVSVPIGPPIRFLILAEYGPLDPPLIAYIDMGEGLPYIGNGLDQVVIPDWLDERGWFRP